MDLLARTRPPLNLVISNVPGPREPLYLAGARLEAMYPVSVVVDGVGLNITVMSYLDHLDFGIVADREQVDDAWSLLDGLRRELDGLVALTGIEGTPERRTPARQRSSSSRARRTTSRGSAGGGRSGR
jgi:hypothetical protein